MTRTISGFEILCDIFSRTQRRQDKVSFFSDFYTFEVKLPSFSSFAVINNPFRYLQACLYNITVTCKKGQSLLPVMFVCQFISIM